MTEKYVQLTQDLQYARRQMQSYKQKQTITQQQLFGVREENKELKKTVERLQQTNSQLVRTNRQLSEEKQSIASDYSTQMSEIKEEIAKKQKQIAQLKQITSPTIVNQELAIRQLRFQLTQQYAHDLALKDRRIEELVQLQERLSYEKEIEKEKSSLKMHSLQAHLKELQAKHESQLQQYSAKLFQLSQVRPPEEREILRRAKRDNQQLKRRLDLATAELSATLQQKNKVHNDYREWMTKYQKQLADHQQQTQTYKEEIARLTEVVEKKSSNREQIAIKERDREIKKLKCELEQMRDQIVSKEKKISDLEVDKAKIQSEIKILKNQQDKVISKVQQADRWEKERLQKELLEARTLLEKLRGQNFQLNDRIHEVNRTAFDSKRHFEQLKQEEEIARYQLRRQVSEEAFKPKGRIIHQSKVDPIYQNQEQAKKLQEALRGEKGKLRDFLAKYIDLKKKYQILEGKFKQANEKIMELLRDKIVLGSPKASGKTFQFPTEPQTRVSPPKHHQPRYNQFVQLHDGEDTVINSIQDLKFMTTAQFKHRAIDSHSKTNPSFNRQYMSPQENRHIKIEDESVESCNERSFYEKSLKIKNQRFKELKCTNHSHEKQRMQSNERV